MRRIVLFNSVFFIAILFSSTGNAHVPGLVKNLATKPSDYFRSATNGDWSASGTWESSPDNITWVPSTLSPKSSSASIIIQANHTVTVTTSISLDQTIIYGTLEVRQGGRMKISDAAGADITISSGGVLQVKNTISNYPTTIMYTGAANINIESNGKIVIGDGISSVGANYEAFATSAFNTWNDNSIFEWNALLTFNLAGYTYFPNAGAAVPVFRVNAVSGMPSSGTTGATINGLLEVNTDLTLGGGSAKTFRDGIRGSATLSENATAGSNFLITSPTAILDGSLTLVLSNPLVLSNGVTIPAAANIKVSGADINKSAGSFLVNGTLDITDIGITNGSGNVTVNGIIKTSRANGFYNPGSFDGGVININPGSTIEYNGASDQSVSTNINYSNITFSGSGVKIPVSDLSASGTIKITGSVILNGSTNNIGGSGTNFTMDGGTFINGVTGIQPNMTGTYDITGGVIQFTNSSTTAQQIRSGETYYNIEVSGKNVANNNGNISLAAGATFSVKSGGVFTSEEGQLAGPSGNQTVVLENGGKFKCNNADGFSGGNGSAGNVTSIKSDIETIMLAVGDTVEYSATANGGDQVVTTNIPYENILLSGAGIKNVTAGAFKITSTGSLDIKSTTSFDADNSTTLDFNNSPVYVRSDSSGTAAIGDLTGVTVLNKNNLTVERYIPAHRAWRLLTAPVISTQTINQAWQENQTNPDLNYADNLDVVKGYGTHITGNSQSTLLGYDPGPQNNSSIKTYNAESDNILSWSPLPAGTGTNNTLVNSQPGFMIFVRGDRSINLNEGSAAQATPTILRAKGQLITGNQFNNISDSGYKLVSNPFPSSLDMRKITRTGEVDPFFFVWDPHLSTVGGFQTFTLTDGDYIPVPGGGSYGDGVYNTIQSGVAFFVHASDAGTLLITEHSKTTTNLNTALRNSLPVPQLRTNLYIVNQDGNLLADGVLTIFSPQGNNALNKNDALKPDNFSEALGILRENKILAVEERNEIRLADTIFYKMGRMAHKEYILEFKPEGFDPNGLSAVLEDSYTNKKTNLDLTAPSRIHFSAIDAASANPDRFRVVFNNKSQRKQANNLDAAAGIVVYPNPVVGGIINLEMINQPAGVYTARLMDHLNQQVASIKIYHDKSANVERVPLRRSLAKGIYHLDLTKPDKTRIIKALPLLVL